MQRKRYISLYRIFLSVLIYLTLVGNTAIAASSESKIRQGKKLLLETNMAIIEERFTDAHRLAEKLIREHADDYQIREYLHLYGFAFALDHEEYRTGGIPPFDSPPPQWLKTEVEAMMAKPDKGVLDLVKLVGIADKRVCGKDFPVKYLEEIVQRFPKSPWAEWAEWLLIEKREYRPREKYREKPTKERYKLLARDIYNASKKFIQEHPNSHMVPGRLHVMAGDCLIISNDEAAKQEAINLSRKILKEYSTAERLCASARFRLRRILGQDYKEQNGWSPKRDRILIGFYSHKCDIVEHKRNVAAFLSVKKDLEAQTEKESAKPALLADRGLPSTAYFLSVAAVVIALTSVILLLRKKARSRGKSRAT